MCEPQRLLTIKDAAQLLNVNPEVLRRWLRLGQIQGVKVGSDWRLRMADLEELVHPAAKTDSTAANQGPKMCIKIPKWLEFSGLPMHLNDEIAPEAWPVFKKLVELDYEKEDREDRRLFLHNTMLAERVGYDETRVNAIIRALEKKGYLSLGRDRKQGEFIKICTPVKTPRMILDIHFSQGGVKGAPEKALENRCLRRYLEAEH